MSKKKIPFKDRFVKQALFFANKYYGGPDLVFEKEEDLKRLTPYQLNKITNWATNTNPDIKAKITGNKYSGRTYNTLKKIF